MSRFKLWLIVPLIVAGPALAQGTHGTTTRSQTTAGARTPVATQPSSDPFHNPIGQGVPPAASANSSQNGNRTNVPAR